jgi:hypothetical protein
MSSANAKTRLRLPALMVLLWLSGWGTAWAQSTANYEPAIAGRDSTGIEEWDHFFPIWGKKVTAKGFELPLPWGINVQYLFNRSDLDIGNLQLGVNGQGLNDVSDFIDVGHSEVVTNSLQLRPDLWVLPFLNVYGIFGGGQNTVDVTVGKPFELNTVLDRTALLTGFGGNLSGAISRYFAVVDYNFVWAHVDGLDAASRANTLSSRLGRSFLLHDDMRIAGWLGFMHNKFDTGTSGSIRVGDALPGIEDFFENYQNTDWYNGLTAQQQRRVDAIFSEIAARDPASSTIEYSIDKDVVSPWSVVFGGQFQFNRSWMLRWEYSHSESRSALLLNLNYRFGL